MLKNEQRRAFAGGKKAGEKGRAGGLKKGSEE